MMQDDDDVMVDEALAQLRATWPSREAYVVPQADFERLQLQLLAQTAVINAARRWCAALDASEDDGQDEASIDTGHEFYRVLADYDCVGFDNPPAPTNDRA